jgi:hypothetical protein
MPAQKEITLFSTERNYRRGADWYKATVLQGAPGGAVCGEASVAYMDGTPFGDIYDNERDGAAAVASAATSTNGPLEDVVPQRIKELLPDVKLICVLRDPVARAYSHYQMAVLDQVETRPFDIAVDQLLEPEALRQARIAPTMTNRYVVNGEYGRVLAGFLRVFPRDRLLPIFSDDLAARPTEVLAQVFDFIGVAGDFVPDNLNARYRTAAVARRIPGLDLYAWQRRVTPLRPARALWHALPERARAHLDRIVGIASFRIEIWNARRGGAVDGVSPLAEQRLITHFRRDSQELAHMLGQEISWLSTWSH